MKEQVIALVIAGMAVAALLALGGRGRGAARTWRPSIRH